MRAARLCGGVEALYDEALKLENVRRAERGKELLERIKVNLKKIEHFVKHYAEQVLRMARGLPRHRPQAFVRVAPRGRRPAYA
jgi:hypothetical protein